MNGIFILASHVVSTGRKDQTHQVWRHVMHRSHVPNTCLVTCLIGLIGGRVKGACPEWMICRFEDKVFGVVKILKINSLELIVL